MTEQSWKKSVIFMHPHGWFCRPSHRFACLDKYFVSKQRCYEEDKIAIVVTLKKLWWKVFIQYDSLPPLPLQTLLSRHAYVWITRLPVILWVIAM